MITCIYDYIFKEEMHKMHDINAWNFMLSMYICIRLFSKKFGQVSLVETLRS